MKTGPGSHSRDPIDATVTAIPVIHGVNVIEALVVPVGDIDGAIRPSQAVDGPKPRIVAREEFATLLASESRFLPSERMPVEIVGQGIGGDIGAAKRGRQAVAFVDDAATSNVTAFEALVRHMLEIAEGKGIVQFTMLGETLDVIPSLHLMQADDIAIIGAGDSVAVEIEV